MLHCVFLIILLADTRGEISDVPETAVLDHNMQHHKIHAGRDGDVKRQKPSRDHIHRFSRELDPDQQAEVLETSFDRNIMTSCKTF